MGEKSSQITHEIEETRTRLGWNLQELEYKVKRLADWRQQFEKRPVAMMGVALGGGMLLASVLGGRRSRYSRRRLAAEDLLSEIVPAVRAEFQKMPNRRCG